MRLDVKRKLLARSDRVKGVDCHPTEPCAIMRANRGTCTPQGRLEPKICANGHYCPPPGKEEIICPKGTFCPSGAFEPRNCTYGALCPEGSVRQLVVLPLVLTIVIDMILILLALVGYGISKWSKTRPRKYTTVGPHEKDNAELLQGPASPGQATLGRTHSASVSSAGSDGFASKPPSTALRRASGKVDHYDGYADDDNISSFYGSEAEDELQNSPNMQRFIRSMSRTVETSSIGLSFDFERLSFKTKGGKKILTERALWQ